MAEWKASGQTKVAFCRQREISAWGLYHWSKRIEEPQGGAPPAFARVDAISRGTATGIAIRLSTGATLELESGFDEESLRRLLRVVAASC